MYKTNLSFFDDFWLDYKINIRRRWYTPQFVGTYKDDAFPAGVYPSLAWCPEVNKYRLWYEALPNLTVDAVRYLAVAESSDGAKWEPVKVQNKADEICARYENICYSGNGGVHGTAVYRDEYEKNPQWRYKAVGMTRTSKMVKHNYGKMPLIISTSPDGISWTEHSNLQVYPYTSDAYNCIYFNPVSEEYNVILRAGFVDRRICLVKSKDLKNWSKPKLIVHPGAEYDEGTFSVQLYSMSSHWNNGMFLGLMWRFHTSMVDEDLGKMNGFMDTELMYSYDGEYWMHTTRKPLVERSQSPGYGFNQLNFSSLVETKEKDRWLLVAFASRMPHLHARDYPRIEKRLGNNLTRFHFYSIRKDGFCGLETCGSDGKIITKAFQLLKPDLTLNVAAETGVVRAAILDGSGQPYEGFSYDDCEPISCDSTAVTPRWKERNLSELVGKRFRLGIQMDSAILYSISATIRPYIVCLQKSISDPLQLDEDSDGEKHAHPFA